jgi:hypothetical protein
LLFSCQGIRIPQGETPNRKKHDGGRQTSASSEPIGMDGLSDWPA